MRRPALLRLHGHLRAGRRPPRPRPRAPAPLGRRPPRRPRRVAPRVLARAASAVDSHRAHRHACRAGHADGKKRADGAGRVARGHLPGAAAAAS
eukprot:3781179-Prymnesium_polylepis.1